MADPTERLGRQARAEALLRDELLTEAFDKLEQEYIKRWRDSALGESVGREKLWQAVTVIARVKQHLQLVAADGRLAAKEVDYIAGRKKLLGVL